MTLQSLRQALGNRWNERVRPVKARRAFHKLLQNPDETEQVFVVIRSLSGRSFNRLLRRVRQDPTGARIMKERRNLIPLLSDRDYLMGLPADTLGHHYGRFMEAEQISAEGLAAASLVTREGGATPLANEGLEAEAFGARLRDMHDLWHVVTGYHRDILGELALLAFTYEQTRNPGIGYIVRKVEKRMRSGNRQVSSFLKDASARGKAAAFLPTADWEALLERPLEDVRRELRVGPPADYDQHRSPAGEAAAAAASA